MTALRQDLHYAFRMLRKSPGFTAITVFILGLGIGANTAMFSVVNAVILQPLPFPHASRLVSISEVSSTGKDSDGAPVSYPNFLDLQRETRLLSAIAAYAADGLTITGHGEPSVIAAGATSSSLFAVLGQHALLGRTLEPQDDGEGAPRVVVIGEQLWRDRFGADPHVIGQTIALDNQTFTVVGVLPASFRFPDQDPPNEIWIPVGQSEHFREWLSARDNAFLSVIGCMGAHITIAQAQAELNTINHNLAKEYNLDPNLRVRVVSLKRFLVGDVSVALFLLLGAVGFVVLIACANIANLVLVRGTARAKEMAVRLALGATRPRIFRQLLTENVLLGTCGGCFGLVLSYCGIVGIKILGSDQLSYLPSIGIGTWVLVFNFVVSILAGSLFGLAPAWLVSEIDVNETLKETARDSTGGAKSHRTRSILVTTEVAIAIVLLIGAGLLLKTLYLTMHESPGFNPRHLLIAAVSLPQARYTNTTQWNEFFDQAITRLKSLPEVEDAAAALPAPFTGSYVTWGFSRATTPTAKASQAPTADSYFVTTDYFRVMGIPLLRGRVFSNDDAASSAQKVIIISRSLERRYFGDEDPIGQSLRIYGPHSNFIAQVVGIAGDVKDKSMTDIIRPTIYFPSSQQSWWVMCLLARTRIDDPSIADSVRERIHQVDPDLPVQVRPIASFIAESEIGQRFRSLLLGVFAIMAFILATLGVYSVLAYTVQRRTHEIGIRMALGASQRNILYLVICEGMRPVLIGLAVGIALAMMFSQILKAFLYHVSGEDPFIFVTVCLIFIAVALVACYVPARRAMDAEPIVALRHE